MAFPINIPYDQILKPGTPVFFYSTMHRYIVGGFIESFRVFSDGSIKYKVGKSVCAPHEIKLTYEEVQTPNNDGGFYNDNNHDQREE